MAASIVTQTAGSTNNGGNVTIALGTLAEDDVIVVVGGFAGGTATVPGVLGPSGFASLMSTVDDASMDFAGQWLRAGATPPTSVLCAGSGDNTDPTAYTVYAVRGVVNTGNPWETVQTSVLSTGVVQAPSVITSTNNAVVLAFGGSDDFTPSPGTVSNFDFNVSAASNETDDFSMAGAASIIATAGTVSPNNWEWETSGSYTAVTVALTPAEEVSTEKGAKSLNLLGVGN